MSQDTIGRPGVRVPEECHCPCHRAPLAVRHVAPCCERCPRCGRRIAASMLNAHLARHDRPGVVR